MIVQQLRGAKRVAGKNRVTVARGLLAERTVKERAEAAAAAKLAAEKAREEARLKAGMGCDCCDV